MTGSDAPCVSVVIVNYNAGDRLSRCLDCLSKQRFRDFEIIIVDNGSRDDSIQSAQKTGVPFELIEIGDNLGFAAANNRALAFARGNWIAFLNPDAYAEPGWLENLIGATGRYPDVDAFGSTQIDAANPSVLDGAGDVYHIFGVPYRGHYGRPVSELPGEGECFAPCAAAAMYRRSTLEALGGFEESYFCYCEDVDLAFRLRLAGGRAIQVRDAVVLHEGSGVTGQRSHFTVYHGHRNRIWTHFRTMPLPLLIISAPFFFLMNFYLLLRFALLGEASPYIRAMKDGFGGISKHIEARKQIQQNRKASVGDIARALTWSPAKIFRRAADIRTPGHRRGNHGI